MHQCTTAAAAPQATPATLVSDAMLVDHYARRQAARHDVQRRPVQAAALSALEFHCHTLAGYRAAETAALGIAILTGRA